MRMDLPHNPKPESLLSYLKSRRPYNAGGSKPSATPTSTGALGEDYTRYGFKGDPPSYPPTRLDVETRKLYEQTLKRNPEAYTIRSFDNLVAWYSDRNGWLVTSTRIGRSGNIVRQAVKGALNQLGIEYTVLRLPDE